MVKVRIAPSPTGAIHIGLARSALYNFLFARQNNGKFILRIEDTDPTRSTKESVEAILEGLKWLSLYWDEGPYFQSQRFPIYKEYAEILLKEGKAYYCYCSQERLKIEKEKALKEKRSWQYDRRCLYLSEKEKEKLEREGAPKAIRFLVPSERNVVFNDIIHGRIEKSGRDIEDFILLRADGTPTYNFACVVDDALMEITHVIRAVEHISNTFKQILLYEALNFKIPNFAHLPLILGKDGKKLSKRHGAVSIMEYKKMGILPEALVNYLALLGWSPGGDLEIFSLEEAIKLFKLEKVKKSNAIFDFQKLKWMNSEYMKRSTNERLLIGVKPFLIERGLSLDKEDERRLLAIIEINKERSRNLNELADNMAIYLKEEITYDEEGIKKFLDEKGKENLKALLKVYENLADFNKETTEKVLRELANNLNKKPAEFIHPLRVALTGKLVGPPIFDVVNVMGKELVIKRIKKALTLALDNYSQNN
jgi:glutamyl-tRNA synthetase